MEYITLIYIVVLTGFQFLIGVNTISFVQARFGVHRISYELVPIFWLVGLLVHLSLALGLKSLGAPWSLATVLPLALGFIHKDIMKLLDVVNTFVIRSISVQSTLWFLLILYLGLSLFVLKDGIQTPWMNNYGDLTFHLGMIHHFVFQADFPPEYHLYAGEPLSYPFLVNFWTALLWWPTGELSSLKWVFVFQWVMLWSSAFAFLKTKGIRYLPWLLLLAGGSLVAIIHKPDTYSWRLINEGFPWTTWLSTVWVTQRSAMFGMVICLASCFLFFRYWNDDKSNRWVLVSIGIILGLSPLAHTHYFIVTALFLGLVLSFKAIDVHSIRSVASVSFYTSAEMRNLWFLVVPSCIALIFFPLLMGKSGMLQWMLGWSVPLPKSLGSMIVNSLWMWLINATAWVFAFGWLWWCTRQHRLFAILAVIFVLGNLVKLAIWDWDQLKVFIAIFTVFVALWSVFSENIHSSRNKKLVAGLFAFTLIGPGVYEGLRIAKEQPLYQVYDHSKVQLAELIRKHVKPTEIIASPTDHNSAATLSGRTLFMGYTGTLASHSIDYRAREKLHLDLFALKDCNASSTGKICPDVVVWDSSARKYWHRYKPADGFQLIARTNDGNYSLYRIVK